METNFLSPSLGDDITTGSQEPMSPQERYDFIKGRSYQPTEGNTVKHTFHIGRTEGQNLIDLDNSFFTLDSMIDCMGDNLKQLSRAPFEFTVNHVNLSHVCTATYMIARCSIKQKDLELLQAINYLVTDIEQFNLMDEVVRIKAAAIVEILRPHSGINTSLSFSYLVTQFVLCCVGIVDWYSIGLEG